VNVVGLTKSFGARTLFEDVSLRLEPGDRLAVTGRNGVGKTTLLRCIAGQIGPDAGEVVLPRGSVIALHDQRPPLGRDITLGDYIAEGLAQVRAVEATMRELETRMSAGDHGADVMGAYDRAQKELERQDGYAWESWLERVQRGLGIDAGWVDRPLGSFSGGELTRASLARALVSRPDVLLLDEPTNHLDLQSVEWLETALSEVDATIVLVSHDRWFLESVTTKVLDLDGARSRVWPMGYSAFRRAKAEALATQATLAAAQAREIARLERFVERWSAGTKARQAQSRKKQLDRIERVAPPVTKERSLAFGFPKTERPGRVVAEAEGLSVGAGDAPLLHDVGFAVERNQRIAVVGPNGAGKTTLVETLIGVRKPTAGRVSLGHRVTVGYFSQHAEELAPERSIIETVLGGTAMTNTQARTLLGRFLFSGEVVDRKVEALSGGERRRLSLVQLIAHGGNFLVLDEPTNHLDIESREALEEAIEAYDGTVMMVSHDRALIDLVATHTLALEDGGVVIRPGGYSDLIAHREAAAKPPPPPVAAKTKREAKPQATPTKPPRRRLREVEKLEVRIAGVEEELREVAAQLGDPAFLADREAVAAAGERHVVLERELAWLMHEWEVASAAVAGAD
jgi:ATP-binding cassette, subfamily F, member 3